MKKSTKAALLSGLIFPGIGHVALRKYLRGLILIATSLAALSILMARAYQHAQLIANRILSGEISMDTEAISQAVAASADASDSLVGNILVGVLAVCWLAGIIDSYRIGASLEG